jgi:DNA polymerase-1
MPLIEVLAKMEIRGVKLDMDFLQALSDEFGTKLDGLEKKIYQEAGQEFNIKSTKQLGEILFEKLLLPVQKKTKTGYSTDVSTLTELSHLHPLPGEILSFRSLAKLKSTYIDNMPALVNDQTGRIHTSFNQTMTATGRLSSSDPNLQNIPIRTEEGRRIREAFIAEPGWKILSADYSQIELRLLAHLSGDENLIDAFTKGEDVHARTASEVWEVSPDEVTADMRREAKVINFGIIYGMSSFGLSKELEISPKQAQEYIDSYFLQYRQVREYLDKVLEDARENEYVSTLMNRRRYLPEINAKNGAVRKFAERTATNAPIQGTAADLIKIAMINIDKELDAKNLKSKMIMQVHDELVFEVPDDEIEILSALVKNGMESVVNLKVLLKVEMSWGKNWKEAH